MFYQTVAVKRFEYSPLLSELNEQTSIGKDQYKLFKNLINNNNKQDNIKKEDNEVDYVDCIVVLVMNIRF